ncbi:MAG: translation elongation factor Ts [Chloroflexi bacterium]|nr:translation elongation factor Ts [Chloroflexota bacterium]MQC26198.1 translation elongation factor Ts [Chloroflexota bacterium]
MTVSADQIKELREATSAGFLDCRKALEESNGDMEKAIAYLREKGLAKAAKRAGREASDGIVELYSHGDGRVGVMVEVNCETDFVARSDAFRELAHEIALQIAASSPLSVDEASVPEGLLAEERVIAEKQAKEEGKPEDVTKRIVEGRITKYLDEVVLLRQAYIRDDARSIQDLINAGVASLGENIIVRRFERWELGEHVDE